MTPITIAGETLTEADIPIDPRFKIVHGNWEFSCTQFDVRLDWFDYDDERKLVADSARCHFLDKAAEVIDRMCALEDSEIHGEAFLKAYGALELLRDAYLASAEKWARIGRAK